jgi:hypothetical protein
MGDSKIDDHGVHSPFRLEMVSNQKMAECAVTFYSRIFSIVVNFKDPDFKKYPK